MKITRRISSWFIIFGWITLNVEYVLAPVFDKRDRTKPTVTLRTPICERSRGRAPWRQPAGWVSEGWRQPSSQTCSVGSLSEKLAYSFGILAQLQRVLSTMMSTFLEMVFYLLFTAETLSLRQLYVSSLIPTVSPLVSAVVACRPPIFVAGYWAKIAGNKKAIYMQEWKCSFG